MPTINMSKIKKCEVCFLIDLDGSVLWAEASLSSSAMPDSYNRWQAIWTHRQGLAEIAHSHPNGPARFSTTDEETMAALTCALGRALRFSVITPITMIARDQDPQVGKTTSVIGHSPHVHIPEPILNTVVVNDEPWWADLLRRVSGMAPLHSINMPSNKTAFASKEE